MSNLSTRPSDSHHPNQWHWCTKAAKSSISENLIVLGVLIGFL
jgi:hypothetical protein